MWHWTKMGQQDPKFKRQLQAILKTGRESVVRPPSNGHRLGDIWHSMSMVYIKFDSYYKMRPLLQIATVHTLKRRKRKWAPEKPTCWLCKTYVSHAVSFTKRFYNGVYCKSSSFLLSSLFNFFSFLISFLNWCKYFIRLYESFVRFHALIFELYICLNFMHIYYIFELYNVCVCLFVCFLFVWEYRLPKLDKKPRKSSIDAISSMKFSN